MIVQFNQEAWLKPYIDLNTKLRAKANNDFEKYFLKINENITNHRDIKLRTTNEKKNINWFHDLITKQGNNGSQKI